MPLKKPKKQPQVSVSLSLQNSQDVPPIIKGLYVELTKSKNSYSEEKAANYLNKFVALIPNVQEDILNSYKQGFGDKCCILLLEKKLSEVAQSVLGDFDGFKRYVSLPPSLFSAMLQSNLPLRMTVEHGRSYASADAERNLVEASKRPMKDSNAVLINRIAEERGILSLRNTEKAAPTLNINVVQGADDV